MIINVARPYMDINIIYPTYSLFLEEISCYLARETKQLDCGKSQQGTVREHTMGIKDGSENYLHQ